jgi:hypothetical protein
MKRFLLLKIGLLSLVILWNTSCTSYLDVVPDNTTTLEDYYSSQEMAWNALAKVYSYLPSDGYTHRSSWLLGDEWMARTNMATNEVAGIRVMRGLQSEGSPMFDLWSGNPDSNGNSDPSSGGRKLYEGIRNCDIFIKYIDLAQDMSAKMIAEWKAHAKFLKAYYHFLLIRQYGPIVIVDEPVNLDALSDELFKHRSKVDDCFDYVIRLIDEAIPDLKDQTSDNDLGQINKMIAMSIKARVLLYRASPFFNGNSAWYADFLDHNSEPFFPMTYSREKWKDAADAAEAAIQYGLANGYDLYTFEKNPYIDDRDDFAANRANMQTLYDLRMVVVEPWNKELIWGLTRAFGWSDMTSMLETASNIWVPASYSDVSGTTMDARLCEQMLGTTYAVLTRYYTKNGLPLDDDLTFDKTTMFELVQTPREEDPEYEPLRGIIQANAETTPLYLDREPRFYANLGVVGGYWRGHTYRISTQFYAGTQAGYNSSLASNYFSTGIGVQKLVHPESKNVEPARIIRIPYPLMRMADLYLIKAEALNEYLETPDNNVYEAINTVRRRAGIPDVQAAWSDATKVRPASIDKHLSKDGMREIILQERGIELSFEGHRFWDMHRHKRAVTEFSTPVMGWNYRGTTGESFFTPTLIQARRFIERDYLWPIPLNEMNINGNLIQNPGW